MSDLTQRAVRSLTDAASMDWSQSWSKQSTRKIQQVCTLVRERLLLPITYTDFF
jgi:hypothetical protein